MLACACSHVCSASACMDPGVHNADIFATWDAAQPLALCTNAHLACCPRRNSQRTTCPSQKTEKNMICRSAQGAPWFIHPLTSPPGPRRTMHRASLPPQHTRKGNRAVLGIEPRTSRTRSENHTTRPNSHCID